jgi:hypothetical protein
MFNQIGPETGKCSNAHAIAVSRLSTRGLHSTVFGGRERGLAA